MATKSTTGPDPAVRSGAGWSEPGAPRAIDPGEHPFSAAQQQRYEDVELAGEGGMGTVAVAIDRRLGREVALKRISVDRDDADGASRLAREAWITARLEHPGIVAVYDAGVDGAGRLYYTMRLIRGRSLADAIRDASGASGRLAMLRHFLDVCQAMAYAHRHGVVHRDLKPANIMVGEFAETQVVDWGLARRDGDRDDPLPVASVEGIAGTPAYLSPERALGGRGERTDDVWALGAILCELITGSRLACGNDRESILAGLRATDPGRRQWPDRSAPELCAIADRALAWSARDRYRDAGELAADIGRYLDGRRVHAHDYSALELLRRVVHAWRWPIRVAGGALIASMIVLTVTWRRIEGERTRALAAEQRAVAALDETGEALAWALDSSALATLAAGGGAEAEVIAAHALARRESADARGVLMAARAGARPDAAERIEVAGCPRVLPDGHDSALCLDDGHLARWQLHPPRELWRRDLVAHAALAIGDRVVVWLPGVAIVLLDRDTGAERTRFERTARVDELVADATGARALISNRRGLIALDLDPPRIQVLGRSCGDITIDTFVGVGSEVFVVCADGSLRRADRGEPGEVMLDVGFGTTLKPASAAALSPDRRQLAIGGIGGEVVLVDLEAGTTAPPRRLADQMITQLAFAPTGLVVSVERGGPTLWNSTLDTELMRLPARSAGRLAIDGDHLVSAGRSWWRWTLPAHASPRVFSAAAGLSGAAVSDHGHWLAAGRGDGQLSVWSLDDGAHRSIALSTAVVKRVDFSPDGTRLAAGMAQPGRGSELIDTATWQRLPHAAATRGVSRVGYLASGELVAVHYGPGLSRWRSEQTHDVIDSPLLIDGDLPPGRAAWWLLGNTGRVFRFDGDAIDEVTTDSGARAIAASADGRWLATAHPTGVAIHDRSSGDRRFVAGGDILDVAISADARWLAGGDAAGVVTVWSLADGHLVATLRGHGQRVAWVGFALGDLWSASWDGTVRRWNVATLDTAPADAIAAAETAWAMGLPEALDSYPTRAVRVISPSRPR